MPFNLCYVRMLLLRMVADGMQVMNNIECGIYSFYVHKNLTVCFPHHSALYFHYFIRQLSAATCCQFTVNNMAHYAVRQLAWRSEDGK